MRRIVFGIRHARLGLCDCMFERLVDRPPMLLQEQTIGSVRLGDSSIALQCFLLDSELADCSETEIVLKRKNRNDIKSIGGRSTSRTCKHSWSFTCGSELPVASWRR